MPSNLSNTTMADSTPGSRPYVPVLLPLYDKFTLSFNMNYVWRCATDEWLLPLFKENFSKNHLDVGVATGFFPATTLRYQASTKVDSNHTSPQCITLLDLNPHSLAMAKEKILSQAPETTVTCILANACELSLELFHSQKFHSISVMNLLHCLPGPTSSKMTLLRNCAKLLDDEGTLFGCTLLGYSGETGAILKRNWLCFAEMKVLNWLGAFDNWADVKEIIDDELYGMFKEVQTWTVGSMLLFKAKKPRRQ